MANELRYDVTKEGLVVTDGTSTEVLANFFAGKKASTPEEKEIFSKKVDAVQTLSKDKEEVQGM